MVFVLIGTVARMFLIRWSAPEGQQTPETIYEILDTHQTKEALSLLLAVGIGFHASNRHLSATE